MSDESSSEQDVNLTSLVYHAVSASNEYVANFDKMLESSSENFFLSREIIQAIRVVLWTDSALISNLFEENQQILDRLKKVATKISQ